MRVANLGLGLLAADTPIRRYPAPPAPFADGGETTLAWAPVGGACDYRTLSGAAIALAGATPGAWYRVDYSVTASNGDTLCPIFGLQVVATGQIYEAADGVEAGDNIAWAPANGNVRPVGAGPGTGVQSSFVCVLGEGEFSFPWPRGRRRTTPLR